LAYVLNNARKHGIFASALTLEDAEELHDLEVIFRLGHPPVVSRYHEQPQVYAPGPGHHISDEAFVTGYVDYADNAEAGKLHTGEADVDRHLPRLFLRKTVAINAGEGLYEGGLSVVYMS